LASVATFGLGRAASWAEIEAAEKRTEHETPQL